jgi:hypothetical protein
MISKTENLKMMMQFVIKDLILTKEFMIIKQISSNEVVTTTATIRNLMKCYINEMFFQNEIQKLHTNKKS